MTDTLVPQTQDPPFHALPAEEVLAAERVDARAGLSADEAARRRAEHGPNRFTAARPERRWRAFVRQYADPMQIVLLVAGLGSVYPLRQLGTGLLLIALTLLNAVLGLRQEGCQATQASSVEAQSAGGGSRPRPPCPRCRRR
ncbi:cation-transporting P-type ATPase [Dactylosporangium sp. NPDC051541]|uniref:cation-transporting P-type ATPase n=1 Tax=Dactylosporangium sp. NPDC051541 TaxID=3363977 RepID=UPI003799D0C9